MEYSSQIRTLLSENKTDEAIALCDQCLERETSDRERAMIYYLRGIALRRTGDRRAAMNSYLEAIALDPEGPAQRAYDTELEVLNFYDHDRYNP